MQTIGIDAGGSLVKVAYFEKGQVHYKIFPNNELEKALQWVRFVAPGARYRVTGGKAQKVVELLAGAEVEMVPEFDGVCLGTKELLAHEKRKIAGDSLVISIGTGTSFYLMKKEGYERLFGSGIGGGTITGLGQLLLGERDFRKIVELAGSGVRGNVDLLVKDLYEGEEPPIPGELTAANFGKPDLMGSKKEDVAAALFQMIGETTVLLARQFALPHHVVKFIYVGTAISQNPLLQKIISGFDPMLQQESIFLENGSFAGALGAIQYKG